MDTLTGQMLQAAFDWETLLPILFFVLYGIAQIFGSKKKKEEPEDSEAAAEAAERARQIREEIRRKIEARRQAAGGQTEPGQQPARGFQYDPTMPDGQHRPASAPGPVPRPVQQHSASTASRGESQTAESASTVAPMASLEARLREQRRILDKARKQQEEAKHQAMRIEREAGAYGRKRRKKAKSGSSDTAGTNLREQILTGLRSQGGLRKAVLYREILDPPLGLR